jgi:hypothetical protein
MTEIQFILIAAFGSMVQEVIHLYDLRNKLHLEELTPILSSWKYWAITGAMILVSGVGTWVLYGDNLIIKSVIFILGAAFPLLFKKLVAGATNNRETELGGFSAVDYFK